MQVRISKICTLLPIVPNLIKFGGIDDHNQMHVSNKQNIFSAAILFDEGEGENSIVLNLRVKDFDDGLFAHLSFFIL